MSLSLRFFDKRALDPQSHIALLKERGLIVDDEKAAENYLRHIGYYRLSAYMKPLQKDGDKAHIFSKGSRFDEIIYLYDFDRDLRLLTMNAIEKIEVSLKSTICNRLSAHYGPTWYASSSGFNEPAKHKNILKEILGLIEFGLPSDQVKNQSLEHYYRQYDYPFYPPAWMVFEAMSFGQMYTIFCALKKEHKNEISEIYGFKSPVISSWLLSVNYTRNLCAHHARLWNRVFTIMPKQPDKKLLGEFVNVNKFYAQAVVLQSLMTEISPATQWAARLNALLGQYPNINTGDMGFPENWERRPLWRL